MRYLLSPLFLVLAASLSFGQKINGVNFVAERTVIDTHGFDELKPLNAKWVAWIPYAFCNVKNGQLKYGQSWQWAGETKKGTIKAIELARKNKLKVMLKPHVWLSDHSFTGKMALDSTQWEAWQQGFAKYILEFACIAQDNNVELFCIGTELHSSVEHDQQYWLNLISQVREGYGGKITYAANWDNFDKIPFWNSLDYIGIDAYFPLSEEPQPTVNTLEAKWSEWKSEFLALNEATKKPILFTEYGYRCTQFNCKNPWIDVTQDPYCEPCQTRALRAMYNSLWAEEWFAGGFLWKWFEPEKSILQESKMSYSVKGKEASRSVAEVFRQTN